MEGLLVFLVVMCFSLGHFLRKEGRRKQIDENMEGKYRQEKNRKTLKFIERFAYLMSRAGFSLPRVMVPYVLFSFMVVIAFLLSLKFGAFGMGIGFLLSPFLLNRLLVWIISRNAKKFILDFELSLDVGASIIRAHGSLEDYVVESISLVGRGWFYREMLFVKKRLGHGKSVVEAFQEMAERVDLEVVYYASQALQATTSQGANTAAVFDDIRMMINRSTGAERKAKSQTTELRRMAYLLVSLPFLMGALFRNSLIAVIQAKPQMLFVFFGVLALNFVGTWVIWKAVKIRV
jgi:Flp pilus assembly protein TadB